MCIRRSPDLILDTSGPAKCSSRAGGREIGVRTSDLIFTEFMIEIQRALPWVRFESSSARYWSRILRSYEAESGRDNIFHNSSNRRCRRVESFPSGGVQTARVKGQRPKSKLGQTNRKHFSPYGRIHGQGERALCASLSPRAIRDWVVKAFFLVGLVPVAQF